MRTLAGVRQAELARLIGATEGQVGTWERGESEPSVAYLGEICRVLGVSGHWLLTGSGPVAAAEIGPVRRDAATGLSETQAFAALGELSDEEIRRLAEVGKAALAEEARMLQVREPPVQRDGYVEEVVREYEVRPAPKRPKKRKRGAG